MDRFVIIKMHFDNTSLMSESDAFPVAYETFEKAKEGMIKDILATYEDTPINLDKEYIEKHFYKFERGITIEEDFGSFSNWNIKKVFV